jgi:NADH-quinone oxidoreductase subunit N
VNPSDVFLLIIPELILGLAACVLFVGAAFRADRDLWATVALLALIGAGVALFFSPAERPSTEAGAFSSLVLDRLAILIKAIALVGGIILVLPSWKEVPDRQAGEYHACLLVIVAGLCLTGAANELVTLFLALELTSIPTYVLLYMPRYDRPAQEAAMKYFLLSIFSSALLLFGFSYLYGLGGTTYLPSLFEALSGREGLPGVAQVALVMVVAGLGFKITAVPFHFYAPDVYQGTPTVAAALLAFVPKVAGFVALVRVLGFVWSGPAGDGLVLSVQAPMLFYILAVVTMSLGNVLGLLQDNLKRLLAYSSVAHAGYMLIGLAVAPYLRSTPSLPGGVDAVLFYLMAYGAMTIGAFAVIAYLSTPQRPVETVDDLAGLSSSRPGVALLMGLFLFSLIGMPLTAGFTGKLQLFFGALAVPVEGHPWLLDHPWLFRGLAVIGVLNAAIGAWYYLRILAAMYLRSPSPNRPLEKTHSLPGLATLWICAALTLFLGIVPAPLARVAHEAAVPTGMRGGAETASSLAPRPSPLVPSEH